MDGLRTKEPPKKKSGRKGFKGGKEKPVTKIDSSIEVIKGGKSNR